MAAGAGDGDAVDGRVELSVAAAVEAMAVSLARADGDRSDPTGAGELGVAGEALGAGDLADELGRRQRPEARLGSSWGATSSTISAISVSSALMVAVSSRR